MPSNSVGGPGVSLSETHRVPGAPQGCQGGIPYVRLPIIALCGLEPHLAGLGGAKGVPKGCQKKGAKGGKRDPTGGNKGAKGAQKEA